MYSKAIKINSFMDLDASEYLRARIQKVRNEINSADKDYILGVDENKYKTSLIEKFLLEILVIDKESQAIDKKQIGNTGEYAFEISYTFTGSSALFQIRPEQSYAVVYNEIYVNNENQTVSFRFDFKGFNAENFKTTLKKNFDEAFENLPRTNAMVSKWNNQLQSLIDDAFNQRKELLQNENSFFNEIEVNVNKSTEAVFSVPVVREKIIPQVEFVKSKSGKSEPTISKDIYQDILKLIYSLGKRMEQKPSLYIERDEQSIREVFLLFLETRYDKVTATGETFNSIGKTDIILKYAEDSSNLFIAECKFWTGIESFFEAIFQLFDRYLTWRDSKAALMIFVKNKEFTKVLEKIKSDINKHPYFVKNVGYNGESSFSYIFRLPQDKDKEVYFEVMAFHFDK